MASLGQPHTVYLALGSNLGDRAALLREALRRLMPQLQVEQASSLYETPPWGYSEQPPFLNAVVRARTILSPTRLLRLLKQVERALGRRPGPRYGPRPVDLDILLYDSLQRATPSLVIPHPRLAERSFVLVPLAEIAPDLRPFPDGPSVAELLAAHPDRNVPRRVGRLLLPAAGSAQPGVL